MNLPSRVTSTVPNCGGVVTVGRSLSATFVSPITLPVSGSGEPTVGVAAVTTGARLANEITDTVSLNVLVM
jgi:hypothetical protein